MRTGGTEMVIRIKIAGVKRFADDHEFGRAFSGSLRIPCLSALVCTLGATEEGGHGKQSGLLTDSGAGHRMVYQ